MKRYIHSDSLYLIDENEERRKRQKEYQHNYYKKITKKKRAKEKELKNSDNKYTNAMQKQKEQ